MMKVNLACGNAFICGNGWLNFDYVSNDPNVRKANLLAPIPLPDCHVDLVYSSHFLEHIPRHMAVPFLNECFRILKPGSLIRLVVPDLEFLCRTFLSLREANEHDKADFLMLELLDQLVRPYPGGELGRYFQSLQRHPQENADRISFVRQVTGYDLKQPNHYKSRSLSVKLSRLPSLLEQLWIRSVLLLLPSAFRMQNVSLATLGERHQWIYDLHSLHQLLSSVGFVAIDRCTASTSRFLDFPFHPLDLSADGSPRKGLDSLFIEARKPI